MSGCSNFRDVGKTINGIAQHKILRENCLYRGGSTDYVTQIQSIGNAKRKHNGNTQETREETQETRKHGHPNGSQMVQLIIQQ